MTERARAFNPRSLGWSAALLAIFLANIFVLVRWHKVDTRPLAWDESIHTRVAYEYRDRLSSEGFLAVLRPAYFNYPPLYHLLLSRRLDAGSEIAEASIAVNLFFLLILLASVYGI